MTNRNYPVAFGQRIATITSYTESHKNSKKERENGIVEKIRKFNKEAFKEGRMTLGFMDGFECLFIYSKMINFLFLLKRSQIFLMFSQSGFL